MAQLALRWLIIALILPALVIQASGSTIAELFRYEREAILAGQLWRLISGHFVHLGWVHFILNAAAVLLLVEGFAGHLPKSPMRLLLSVTGMLLGISLGLLVADPELEWYVGLSGLLHGLAVLIAIDMWRKRQPVGLVLLAGVLVKVLWEQVAGSGSDAMFGLELGGDVIVNAHLYGVISAVVVLLVTFGFEKWKQF